MAARSKPARQPKCKCKCKCSTAKSVKHKRTATTKPARTFSKEQRERRAAAERQRRETLRARKLSSTFTLPRKHTITDKIAKDQEFIDSIQYKLLPDGPTHDNITLMDERTGSVILQRISPTSAKKKRAAEKSAQDGRKKFEAYVAKKPPEDRTEDLTKRLTREYHLGIWHTTGQTILDFTGQSRHEKCRAEALDLLLWAKEHSNTFLTPLREHIHPSFYPNLKHRAGTAFEWLTKNVGKKSTDFLHPWYTTIALFAGFSAGAHTDHRDEAPSFLYNFGGSVFLELPEFAVRILVRPLDIVILNSPTFYHRTQPAGEDEKLRWSMSSFFRTSIFIMQPVTRMKEEYLNEALARACS